MITMTSQVSKAVEIVKRAGAKAKFTEQRKYRAYELRIQGYSIGQIAEEMHVSRDMVYKYLQAAQAEQPEIRQILEEFVRFSLARLEMQYMYLQPGMSSGDPMANKVGIAIIELQGKFLGAFTQNINVSEKVTYQLDGVDVGDV